MNWEPKEEVVDEAEAWGDRFARQVMESQKARRIARLAAAVLWGSCIIGILAIVAMEIVRRWN